MDDISCSSPSLLSSLSFSDCLLHLFVLMRLLHNGQLGVG